MPHANQLPPTLAPLARRNAVEINPITFDVNGHDNFPIGGQEISPLVDVISPRWRT
jgi:hypothetical protein